MSDDFMKEIADAVDGGNKPVEVDTSDLTNDVKTAKEQENVSTSVDHREKLENDLLDMTASPEEREAENEAQQKRKDKEKEAKAAADKKKAEEDKQKQQQTNQDDKSTNQQQTQQQTQQTDKKQVAALDRFLGEDDSGNLVLADGTIVAASGKAREHFEKVKREGREARDKLEEAAIEKSKLGQKFQQLYNAYNEQKNSPEMKSISERTGMDVAEVNDAINYMKAYKENPIEGLKKLLTKAASDGIDIKSLGVQGGFDPATMTDIVRQAMSAQNNSTQTEPDLKQLQQDAVKEAKKFLSDYPEATQHVSVLAQAKKKFPNASLQELWYGLLRHQRKLQEQEEQNAFTTNVKKSQSDNSDTQQQQQQQPRKRVSPPTTDYTNMSFSEIANSIKDELT